MKVLFLFLCLIQVVVIATIKVGIFGYLELEKMKCPKSSFFSCLEKRRGSKV